MSKNVLKMTEEELNAELRAYGIDPSTMMDHAFQKVCVLAKNQAKRIAAMETELETLKEQIGGFPNVNALRESMVETADENAALKAGIVSARFIYVKDLENERRKIAALEAQLAKERDDTRVMLAEMIRQRDEVTAERNTLKTQVERMSAPVTMTELEPLNEKYGYFQFGDAQGDKSLAFANSLIATRKEEK